MIVTETNLSKKHGPLAMFPAFVPVIFLLCVVLGCIAMHVLTWKPPLYVGQRVWGAENSENTLILDVPFIQQEQDFYCSETVTSMVMGHYGCWMSQDEINVNAPNFENLVPWLRGHIPCQLIYHQGENELRREISQGRPVMVRPLVGRAFHTVLVVGYGPGRFYIHDPVMGGYMISETETLAKYRAQSDDAAIVFRNPIIG